jgi:hypothetical protein
MEISVLRLTTNTIAQIVTMVSEISHIFCTKQTFFWIHEI